MILKLELYSRPGCHLCDEMVAELKTTLRIAPYRLDIIDIDSDPALQQLYAARIPVLICNDHIVSEYYLDKQKISDLLMSSGSPGQ